MQNTLVVSDELALANVKSNSWSVLFIDDPTGKLHVFLSYVIVRTDVDFGPRLATAIF